MTKEEKDKLHRMRVFGKSYADIAELLNMKEASVRTYCSRNGLTDKDIVEIKASQNVCLCCGEPIEKIPKQKPKKFCSDKCRMKWWAKHRDEMVCKANYTIKCQNCGKEFISYGNKERKYCSRECYFADRTGNR